MKAIVCEMCGSNDLIKQDGMYVCQNCGTKYSTEEAKKLLVEVAGQVKIDTTDELKNLYELARRAKGDNDSENAQKYYEQIIVKDPSSWEAAFYTTYYQAMNCKIGQIGLAANRVTNSLDTVFTLIKNNVTDAEKQKAVVDEITIQLMLISRMLFHGYQNHYNGIDSQIQDRFKQEYINNCYAATEIVYTAGDLLIKHFGDMYGKCAADCWKLAVIFHNTLNGAMANKEANAKVINEYNQKISKYDPTYKAPETNMKSDGGCYIATAVYGSYDCPEVWVLRRFRDNVLANAWYGRAFIRMYYFISPKLVKRFGNTIWFTQLWKPVLDKTVDFLRVKGFTDRPYNDKG